MYPIPWTFGGKLSILPKMVFPIISDLMSLKVETYSFDFA